MAGLPTSVPATTVNRLCGSSLDGAIVASSRIALGEPISLGDAAEMLGVRKQVSREAQDGFALLAPGGCRRVRQPGGVLGRAMARRYDVVPRCQRPPGCRAEVPT